MPHTASRLMKKTNQSIKSTSLNLKKETVAVLSRHKLEAVHGAMPPNTGISACKHECDSAVICG
jgi:hypothetical protein